MLYLNDRICSEVLFLQTKKHALKGESLMKTVNKKLLAVAVAGVLGMGGSVSAMAEDGLSANVGFVSNYVWRGLTASDDKPAIQGGFDYADGEWSVGVWGSSLGVTYPGPEVDLYGSYNFGPVAVGAIYYAYPSQTGSDFYEVNIGGDVGPVSLMASYSPDVGGVSTTYVEAGYSFEMTKGVSLDLHLGSYTDPTSIYDYSIGVSGSAGGFDLGLTATGIQDGDSKAFVSVSKSI
jgi:uncharacterized protein (TIGR02001 family)